MSSRYTFKGHQFYELLRRMFEKQVGEIDIDKFIRKKGKSRSFGYDNYDIDSDFSFKNENKNVDLPKERKNTLKFAVVEDKKVKEYMLKHKIQREDLDFKRLYQKHLDYKKAKKPNQLTLGIHGSLASVCLIYVGIKDVKELDQEADNNLLCKTNFRGCYYSYQKHTIKHFDLNIWYDEKNADYIVEEKKFHENTKAVFSGTSKIRNGRLSVLLTNESYKGDLFLIIFIPGDINKSEALAGTLSTVSSYAGHYPMSVEFVLVKTENNLHHKYSLEIERYLFLHRYNYRIRTIELHLGGLKARGKEVDFVISRLKGHYRVWRFDEYFNIVQSSLEVKENYEVTCRMERYDVQQYNEQICLLYPTKNDFLEGNVLCISTHPKIHTGIISYLMINVVRPNAKIINGQMIYMGGNGSLAKRAIILEAVGSDNNIEPRLIKRKNIKKELSSKPLSGILKKLIKQEVEGYLPSELTKL